jgi:hypothetical protein
MRCYEYYGKGILEAIYARGHGRLGDAIASARNQYIDYFIGQSGIGGVTLGQFNLLGDPALDISDRVRYPDKCDLSIYGGEIAVSQYPEESSHVWIFLCIQVQTISPEFGSGDLSGLYVGKRANTSQTTSNAVR